MSARDQYSEPVFRSPRFPSSKFSPPTTSPDLVHRSSLFGYLDRAPKGHLTLVVGSSGAGKTTLLADWVATHPDRPCGWLNCDSADADPVRFVAAVVEAGRRACQSWDFGADALQLLSLDGEVSADVVAALADDLERPDAPAVLVIDDFHLAGASGAETLGLLLQYPLASVRLVVASRVDPPLRLHRMRANQELVEVRERELSFSAEETRRFFATFGVALSETELAVVHQRSEGWVAGLQMAAISIRGSSDPGGAARRVELQSHTVAGYFLEEVLYRQPSEVAEFMLAVSVLDELSVPACSALWGAGAADLLERLYSNHLFVTRADDNSRAFRYHHLVQEVLRAELHSRDPDRKRSLHECAAGYLANAGQVGSATRQLLAAGDAPAAFRLLRERLLVDFDNNPRPSSALEVADVRPDLFAGDPGILIPLAAELGLGGAFGPSSRALMLAEQTGVDPEQEPELAVQLAFVKAGHLELTGQLRASLEERERAQTLRGQSKGVDLWFVGLDHMAAFCYTHLGDFVKARQFVEAVGSAHASPPLTEVYCPGARAQIAWAEGALTEADDWAADGLDAARRLGFERHYFAFPALRTAALLAWERRDLGRANDLIERTLEIVSGGRPSYEYLAQLDRARMWAAGGEIEEALTSLPRARRALKTDQSILFVEADELEARFRLALADRKGAISVAERLPDDRRLVVSALIALAENDPDGAGEALTSRPGGATTTRSDLELRLLWASAAILRNSPQAPQLVSRALNPVDRHGYLQTVLDTAPQVVDYLIENPAHSPNTDAVRSLIAARLSIRRQRLTRAKSDGMPDDLTDAELRVLEALAQRLTYADMAAQLHLSLNTVKTHLRHAYVKLDVTSRAAAVQRATALGLI